MEWVASNIRAVEITRGYHAAVGTIYYGTLPLLLQEAYPGFGLSIPRKYCVRGDGFPIDGFERLNPGFPSISFMPLFTPWSMQVPIQGADDCKVKFESS